MFYVAAGLIALHVVDDNFVQPRAGTSAVDHMVSGFGTLGLVGARRVGIPPGPGRGGRGDRARSSGSAA